MDALFSSASREWKEPDEKSQGDDKWRVKMAEQGKTGEDESPPSINLGLWLGGPTNYSSCDHHRLKTSSCDSSSSSGSGSGRIVKVEDDDDQVVVEEREKQRSTKCSVVCFTEEQIEELKIQILIFKYIASGLAVPLQLLHPIWRGFSSSSVPPLLGLFHLGFDRYMMDPEPGRCRRTDGKKWRCHQSVIPNEKYCERHMHRGRKRSRKLVEASTREASPSSGTLNLMNANRNNNPNSDLKSKFRTNLEQNYQLPAYKNPLSSYSSVRGNSDSKYGPTRVLIRAPGVTNTMSKTSENAVEHHVGKHNSSMKERIAAINLSSGLDFSPKSVLQGQGYPRVGNHNNNLNSDDVGRCRRTDGKKWRCSNKVLPDQKYCAHHMNRGSKKPAVALSASGESKITYGSASSTAKFYEPERAKMSMGLDTNLNFSLNTSSADPRQNIQNNCVAAGDNGSGSTTETTVTDDSTDVSDMNSPSP